MVDFSTIRERSKEIAPPGFVWATNISSPSDAHLYPSTLLLEKAAREQPHYIRIVNKAFGPDGHMTSGRSVFVREGYRHNIEDGAVTFVKRTSMAAQNNFARCF